MEQISPKNPFMSIVHIFIKLFKYFTGIEIKKFLCFPRSALKLFWGRYIWFWLTWGIEQVSLREHGHIT